MIIASNGAAGQPIALSSAGVPQLESSFTNSSALVCPLPCSPGTTITCSYEKFTPAQAYAASQQLAQRKQKRRSKVKRLDAKKELTPEAKDLSAALQLIKQTLMTPAKKGWEVYQDLIKQIPDYKDGNAINSFYKDIEMINGGSSHAIFKATLLQDRETAKKGTTIALRVIRTKHDKGWFPRNLEAYCKLFQLREFEITEFIPEIHGVYYTSYSPALDNGRFKSGDKLLVTEMDFLEQGYEQEYYDDQKPITPRVAFEHIIGKWAVYKIAQCSITDYDGDVLRHYMLQHDPNYVVYHIGERSYLFEPGYSPRQIDYDDYMYLDQRTSTKKFERFSGSRLFDFEVESLSMKRFLSEIREKGIIDSANNNLREFEVSGSHPIPHVSNIKHFYIPEDQLTDQN